MITLGDAAVYSTCSYVTHELQRRGYETETLSGVPSFCIAAAKAGISLCEGNETLAVVPAVEPNEKFEKILDNRRELAYDNAENDNRFQIRKEMRLCR